MKVIEILAFNFWKYKKTQKKAFFTSFFLIYSKEILMPWNTLLKQSHLSFLHSMYKNTYRFDWKHASLTHRFTTSPPKFAFQQKNVLSDGPLLTKHILFLFSQTKCLGSYLFLHTKCTAVLNHYFFTSLLFFVRDETKWQD